MSVDNVVIGLVILNDLEIKTQISLLGQIINRFQIARTVETIMVVERIGQIWRLSFMFKFA